MALRDFRTRTTTKDGTEAMEPVAARVETYLDAGCELVGELRFQEAVRIDGRVEGGIRAAKSVVVGEGATVEANIEAESVEIYGTVKGDVHVKRKTTLHESARVTGEIQTAGIVVEEGARFKGCIVIGGDEASEAKPAKPSEKKASAPVDPKPTVAAAKPKEGIAA